MNNLLYARLAKTNLSKNRQNILPYLLSCIGTVVMFFIMDTLAQGSGFDSMIGKDTILAVMGMGTYIIGLFAVIFLIRRPGPACPPLSPGTRENPPGPCGNEQNMP